MIRFFAIAALALAALPAKLPAAHAEFFSLAGRFRCLESGAPVCGDAQLLVQPQAAAPPSPVAAEPVTPRSVEVAQEAPPPPTPAIASVPGPPVDPLRVVAARIQARRPSRNDLAWLTQAAREGNGRAIELFAWCKLNGIGMARDPIAAFLLYGAAGNAALPNARENQRLIFERDLDSDQRQQLLDLANEGVTLARLMPSAR